MENIEKFYPLLSKCNDAIVVERSVQDILKASLFSTSEMVDASNTSLVTPYLLTTEKNLLANLHQLIRTAQTAFYIACHWFLL